MEAFKGYVRSVVAFSVCLVGLTALFSLMLFFLPALVAVTAFSANEARNTLRQKPDGDPVSELMDSVLLFVLRLAPDCPAQEPKP